MKLCFALTALLFACVSWAASTSIRPLYQDSSFVPSNLLPFEVQGGLIDDGGKISKIVITENLKSVDCRVMVDPYHSAVFLLKCVGETTVRLSLHIALGNAVYEILYGPLEIKNPATGLKVVEPVNPSDPDWTAGKALFSACIECHTANSLKGKTASAIYTNTFSTSSRGYSQMFPRADIKGLTNAQRSQIEKYLANPTRNP